MSFPSVELSIPYVGQTLYQSNFVKIIKVDDDVEHRSLRIFCQLGDNASFKYWITVLSDDNYTADWTNEMLETAIRGYFVNA